MEILQITQEQQLVQTLRKVASFGKDSVFWAYIKVSCSGLDIGCILKNE